MLQIWLALIGGLFLGWLIEWLIDWIFWRRNAEALRQDNQALRLQLDQAHAELAQLKTPDVGAQPVYSDSAARGPSVPDSGNPVSPSTEGK